MNSKRLIFYAVFGLFHLFSFLFTLTLEDVTQMLSLVSWIPYFKYLTLLGLLLLITDFVWSYIVNRDTQKEKDALSNELTHLKAKLFDLQEGKNTPTQKTPKP